jgi:RNA exonuclease 1
MQGWEVLQAGEVANLVTTKNMLPIDCEMVLCDDGTEAVVRVCVVDDNLEVLVFLYLKYLKTND